MAIITLCLRNDVLRGLVTNVTTIARARHDICMIEHRRRPGVSAMAVITRITTDYVGRPFAVGNTVVVAATAGTDYLQMIDAQRRLPRGASMTVLANIRGSEMHGRLVGQMTTRTAAGDIGMIKHGR